MPATSPEAIERKNRKRREKRREAAVERPLPKVRTGTREYRRAVQFKFGGSGEMTKREIEAMLAQAAANTAAMSVEGL